VRLCASVGQVVAATAGELPTKRRDVESLDLSADRTREPPAVSTDVARDERQGDSDPYLPGGLVAGRSDADEDTTILGGEGARVP
jgi:hypothetical protein